ncbi:hypothetical protein [Acetanaerobacterium elongatum]|uniref:hypothetical protein n=1 Tax=Acetanaerobacterium elongatum TaxID=258515 RepID=UPI003BFA6C6D
MADKTCHIKRVIILFNETVLFEVTIISILQVNAQNIANEHICCAISDKKGETCVSSKKVWMLKRFEEELFFKKLDARGKVFMR